MFRRLSLLLLPFLLLPLSAHAQDAPGVGSDGVGSATGLPIPRFVSLSAGKARMRAGPGRDYPVKWLYVRRHLPMEVVGEYDQTYRKVRGPGGEEGWMDRALLSGERYAMIFGKVATVRARPEADAPPVWRAEPGVLVNLQLCAEGWCRVSADGRAGYVRTLDLWGVYPQEEID